MRGTLLLVLPLVMIGLPLNAWAQDALVIRYSRLTRGFDGLPPIGQRFQIKGTISQDVLAVKVESFGFIDGVPSGLVRRDYSSELCEALSASRDPGKNIVHAALSWERPQSEAGMPATEFTVNHPRLYYGREYFFLITYYEALDKEKQKAIAEQALRAVFGSFADFDRLVEEGLRVEKVERDVKRAYQNLQVNVCPNQLLSRSSTLPADFFDLFQLQRSEVLDAIAFEATRIHSEIIGKASLSKLSQDLSVLDKLPASLNGSADSLRRTVADSLWEQAGGIVRRLIGLVQDGKVEKDLEQLRKTLSDIIFAGGPVETPKYTIDSIATRIVEKLPLEDNREFLSSTSVRPYFETMKDRLPFIISLDGGLIYVPKFKGLIPILGFNLKLNRVDFDDPKDRRPEFSIIVGFGLEAPDNLDPEYGGIFGATGERSLALGLGVRWPSVSGLLRFQLGALLYKQKQSSDPSEEKLSTKTSFYIGVSLNWDAIDFAAKLFSGRPEVNF